MGNSTTPIRPELYYVRTVDDDKFGRVYLYRRNYMEYIMKKTFTFVNHDSTTERVRAAIAFMEKEKHIGLPTVHHISRVTYQQLCIYYDKVDMYVDYYNYTFDSILKGGKQIEQAELWYALSVLSYLGHILQTNKIPCNPFHLDQIFITLKGSPSIYVCYCLAIEYETNFYEDLAKVIMSLALMRKVYTIYLEYTEKTHPLLTELLGYMVNKRLKLKQVHYKIEEYAGTNRIKIANAMRLSKFKAMIPPIQRYNSREVLKISRRSVARSYKADSTGLNSTQRSSQDQKAMMPRPIAIECLKQLEERKLENEIKERMMKQRMQYLLGKYNLSINRTAVTNSVSKAPMKRPPTANTSAFNRNSASKK